MEASTKEEAQVVDDRVDEEHDAVLVDVERLRIGGESYARSTRSFSFEDEGHDDVASQRDSSSSEDAGDCLTNAGITDDCVRGIARRLLGAFGVAQSTAELNQMVGAMKVDPVAAHDVVVAKGDSGGKLYIIQEGEIQLARYGDDVLVLSPGDHFGTLVDAETLSEAVVVATKASVLWVLENADFESIRLDALSSLESAQIDRMTHLRLVDAFMLLSDDQIAALACSFETAIFQAGECIIQQGDFGDYFYVIQEGEVICKSTGSSLARHRGSEEVARMFSRDYFGELSLLNGMPRSASVYANDFVKCLCLSREAFTALLSPLAEVFEENHLMRILEAIPELAGLSIHELQFLLSEMEVEMYYDGETIFHEGGAADALFIIKSGCVYLVSEHGDSDDDALKPHGLALTANDAFGFESLASRNQRYACTAIACGDVQVLYLRRSVHRIALPDRFEKETLKAQYGDQAPVISYNGTTPQCIEEPAYTMFNETSPVAPDVVAEVRAVLFETAPNTGDTNLFQGPTPVEPITLDSVQLNDLKQSPSIAVGVMAKINLTQVRGSDQLLILKVMNKENLVSNGLHIHPLREKTALMEIRPHPMIVKLYKTFQDRDNLYTLLEYVPCGELFQLFINTPRLSDGIARFYAANAILGLQHIHSEGFIYRNMRPENLVIGADGYLKFVDFAFAKRLPFVTIDERGAEWTHTRTWTICGTPDYLAPEIVMGKGHNRAVDYWTLGIMIYELLVGSAPFAVDESSMVERYGRIIAVGTGRNQVMFPSNAAVSTEARDLITHLLRGDPSDRLGSGEHGAQAVRAHAWFSSVDWDKLLSKDISAPTRPMKPFDGTIHLADSYFSSSSDGDGNGHFAGF